MSRRVQKKKRNSETDELAVPRSVNVTVNEVRRRDCLPKCPRHSCANLQTRLAAFMLSARLGNGKTQRAPFIRAP